MLSLEGSMARRPRRRRRMERRRPWPRRRTRFAPGRRWSPGTRNAAQLRGGRARGTAVLRAAEGAGVHEPFGRRQGGHRSSHQRVPLLGDSRPAAPGPDSTPAGGANCGGKSRVAVCCSICFPSRGSRVRIPSPAPSTTDRRRARHLAGSLRVGSWAICSLSRWSRGSLVRTRPPRPFPPDPRARKLQRLGAPARPHR